MTSPTLQSFLRQRFCSHSETSGYRAEDFGEVIRCDVCGFTVWTDPPDLKERVEEWVVLHTVEAANR